MITKMKRFDGGEGNVWKYVVHFDKPTPAIAEAVLYRYGSFNERTVACCSVQSGCPVGCTFCGTGKKFIRNLSTSEIVQQVIEVFKDQGIADINDNCAKLQIMFMSMGEPFLNYNSVSLAIEQLHDLYPNAELLVSTIAPMKPMNLNDFITLSKRCSKVGLQFSIHASDDTKRNALIPYNKLSLVELRNYGTQWWHKTGRKPYINYCVTEDFNYYDMRRLHQLFPTNVFNVTLSVLCSTEETMKEAGYRDIQRIRWIADEFMSLGYNVRVFDPAGQDDIGGGCGQLWYVQQHLLRSQV